MSQMPLKGPIKDDMMPIIHKGGILIDGKSVADIGKFDKLKDDYLDEIDEIVHLDKDYVCLPGLVDAHTHICFAGSRAKDFALRNSGMSYLEIAQQGGGIWDTVCQTRSATKVQLKALMISRISRHISFGVTTIEIKSGYGLSVDEELRMLRCIHEVADISKIRIVATCLAAHMKPHDVVGSNKQYLDMLSHDLLPRIKSEGLSDRVDAFIEKGAFSPSDMLDYFSKAHAMSFDITVHADQFTPMGSKLAIEVGAVSADHLEASSQIDIDRLAQSNTVATALPGASLGLGCEFAPARRLLDAGACLAIASDWNPGSAPMGDLVMQGSVLGTFEKLTTAEVLGGMTFRAAHALRLPDVGLLMKGSSADMAIFPCSDHREILYQQGLLRPSMVYAEGQLIYNERNNV